MNVPCRWWFLGLLLAACGGSERRGGPSPNPNPNPNPNPSGPCGNGVLNGLEACDGLSFAMSNDCTTFNLGEGAVTCTNACALDFSRCNYPDYCTANNLYSNQQCDPCELLGGVPDPECMALCGADGMCADRIDPLTGQWTCRRRGLVDPDCGMCGNAILENNEECDGPTLKPGKNRCEDWGFEGGTLGCTPTCLPNFANCTASRCGDGMRAEREACDGTDFGGATCESLGFAGGTLSCNQCGIAATNCVAPGCGNAIVEPLREESCDGTNLGTTTCESLGFAGGTLSCDGTCQFNTAQCVAAGCGNEIIEAPLEECEGSNLNGATCESEGFLQGTLRCSSTSCTYDVSGCVAPGCGNTIIEAPTEQCEGSNLAGATCQSLGFVQGTLSCDGSCRYDTSMCVRAGCGNMIIEAPAEQCEGANLNGATCESLGFLGGSLSCNGMCRYDTTQCASPVCGNDITEGNERCDGSDLNGLSCSSLGLFGDQGDLYCSNCQPDTFLCVGCGNGRADGLEACDGTNRLVNCADLGWSGNATCNAQCAIDFASCGGRTDFCQANGYYNDGVCDPCHLLGGMRDPDCNTHCGSNGTCASYFDVYSGRYTCELTHNQHDPDCGCGNGQLRAPDASGVQFELCDGTLFQPGFTCTDLGYQSGTVRCQQCKIDVSGCRY